MTRNTLIRYTLAALAVLGLSIAGPSTAQPDHGATIAIWVYPSGKLMHNPPGLEGVTCVLAVGHPERPPEVHCVPTPHIT